MPSLQRRATFVLAFFATTLVAADALAQRDDGNSLPSSTFEIAGQVRSADGKATLTNVIVRLERFGGGLVDQSATDSTGRFRFAGLATGQYVVNAKTEGHAAASSQLDITRLIPRQYVILQLQPERETFRARDASPNVVDARVPAESRREFERGRDLLGEGRADEAARHLEKSVALHAEFYDAHALLGRARMELKEWPAAERHLRRAVELRPRESVALIYLGEVLRRQKKYAEAEATLVSALKLNRASWQGHFTLGRVYWETNEVSKAAPHVGQALSLNPDYAEAHLLAGNIFMRLSMPQNALVSYEDYLRLAPRGEFARQTEENVRKLRKALADKKP